MQQPLTGDAVEFVRSERQVADVGRHQLVRAREVSVCEFLFGDREHVGRVVHSDHVEASFGKRDGDDAGTAPEVEGASTTHGAGDPVEERVEQVTVVDPEDLRDVCVVGRRRGFVVRDVAA